MHLIGGKIVIEQGFAVEVAQNFSAGIDEMGRANQLELAATVPNGDPQALFDLLDMLVKLSTETCQASGVGGLKIEVFDRLFVATQSGLLSS